MRFPVAAEVEHFLKRVAELSMRVYLQPKLCYPFQVFGLPALRRLNPVTVEVERAFPRNRWIQLPQRPGCGVSRIGKSRLASLFPFVVELTECFEAEKH